jgi:acyl-CoA synthetase (AMP-forming)/AMP-acid ligase II
MTTRPTSPSTVDDPAQAGLQRSRRLVLGELLARNARLKPDKVALIFEGAQRTFAELDARVNRLANALAARGVKRGDNVALLMYNRMEVVEAFFGCQKLGATPVPVNFRLVQAELDYILANSEAVGIIADSQLATRAAAAHASVDGVRFHLAVGDVPEGAEPYEDALAAASPEAPDVVVQESDLAFLMYTSGTTGRPKGAMLSHQNLWAHTTMWIHELGATADDVWLSGLPLFHIGGVNGVLPFIFLGGTVIITPSTGFDAGESIDLLYRHRATMCYFVPTQWQEVCSHPHIEKIDPTVLRKAFWGASQAPRSTLELMSATFPDSEIVNAFGQTEMSSCTCFLKGPDSVRKMGSVGQPVLGLEVRIVDDEGNDVAQGEVGEIVYRGATVTQGYFRNEAATDEAFEGGWFHSGDLVQQDDEGYIYVVDRKKDMIISGGENIYPAEIEAVLVAHEAVAEVAVIGVPHEKWVETPLAVVVPADGAEVSEAELIELCRNSLAGYKKPSGVVFADALPRNASGKILKRTLREEHTATATRG